MLPVIVIVGRPNVGKSTLFNCLTVSRDALVADRPGLTRDRKYGVGKLGGGGYVVVDTGGLSGERDGLSALMAQQVRAAIDEADHLLLMVDARVGATADDELIVRQLRKAGKPLTLVVNKIDGLDELQASSDFHALGLGEPRPVAAAHGRGVRQMIESVLAALPSVSSDESPTAGELEPSIKIAVVGRPNVGKSTLVNRMLGEERVLAFDEPGTTRDSIYIPFQHQGSAFTLIDTAGVRRRARVREAIEKFSVIKTLQALDACHVALLVVDARQGISEQDSTLAGHVLESGRCVLLVVNKWDGLTPYQRDVVRRDIDLKLGFLDFAPRRFVSALHGSGIGDLFDDVKRASESAGRELSASKLTQALEQAVTGHQPPLVRGRRIKLRYAHQGGRNPPLIVVHGNQTDAVPEAYRRYLANYFRRKLELFATPVRVEFKGGENPFQGRRNMLTDRQLRKRQRLKKFVTRRR